MRKDISVVVTPEQRVQLEAIVKDRNRPQKHVWRAKIVLATDASWQSGLLPILKSGIYFGEIYDATQEGDDRCCIGRKRESGQRSERGRSRGPDAGSARDERDQARVAEPSGRRQGLAIRCLHRGGGRVGLVDHVCSQ